MSICRPHIVRETTGMGWLGWLVLWLLLMLVVVVVVRAEGVVGFVARLAGWFFLVMCPKGVLLLLLVVVVVVVLVVLVVLLILTPSELLLKLSFKLSLVVLPFEVSNDYVSIKKMGKMGKG